MRMRPLVDCTTLARSTPWFSPRVPAPPVPVTEIDPDWVCTKPASSRTPMLLVPVPAPPPVPVTLMLPMPVACSVPKVEMP